MIAEEADPVGITLLVTEVLEALGVRYLIGGSLASIFHGMIRTGKLLRSSQSAPFLSPAQKTRFSPSWSGTRPATVSLSARRDVLGVVKAQGDRLDLEYLRQMAATLGVSELLEQALVAAEH